MNNRSGSGKASVIKMLSKYLARIGGRADDEEGALFSAEVEYKAYTTKFDVVIEAEKLDELLGTSGEREWRNYVSEYDSTASKWRDSANFAGLQAVEHVRSNSDATSLNDTVACLLLDHSGSLRGQRAIMACAAAEVISDCWSRLGIPFEILGFTTSNWHGGKSRKAWRNARKPKSPGRLCDLLHIVYRSADCPNPGCPWSIRNLLRHDLLKENVDGEALLWAAERLGARSEQQKLIVVVSDGAPVDDSTLLANGLDYLHDHLHAVISQISSNPDHTIAGIGIDHDASDFYPLHLNLSSTEQFRSGLPDFIAELLTLKKSENSPK